MKLKITLIYNITNFKCNQIEDHINMPHDQCQLMKLKITLICNITNFKCHQTEDHTNMPHDHCSLLCGSQLGLKKGVGMLSCPCNEDYTGLMARIYTGFNITNMSHRLIAIASSFEDSEEANLSPYSIYVVFSEMKNYIAICELLAVVNYRSALPMERPCAEANWDQKRREDAFV